MHPRPRHAPRTAARLLVPGLAVLLAACEPSVARKPIDTELPTSTTIDLRSTTSGPPTTPLPTAYPTVPPVTAAAPYWAPQGWDMDQVRAYLDLVETALSDLGAEHSIDSYNGTATLANGTQVDLTLLAARLTLQPASRWQSTVDAYLASALSPDQAEQNLTYAEAQPLLRVRVGTPSSLGLSIDQGIIQPIVDDLVLAVVVEREIGTVFLAPAQLSTWNRTADQILATAIAQTLARPVAGTKDGPFTTVTDDPLASAWLLDPTVVMRANATNGYLIAIPSVDQFIAIEAGPKLTPSTIQAVVEQVADDFSNRNNPASPDLYWWRNGVVITLRQQGDGIAIPDELQAIINPPSQS